MVLAAACKVDTTVTVNVRDDGSTMRANATRTSRIRLVLERCGATSEVI